MKARKNNLFLRWCSQFTYFCHAILTFSCTLIGTWLYHHAIARQFLEQQNSSDLQNLSKLQGSQHKRNRLPRTQCRQVGRQQLQGRQNHPGKRLYLHQAQQHRTCSQWFRRNRHNTIAFSTEFDVYFNCLEVWRKGRINIIESFPASSGFCGGQRNRLNFWSVDEWKRYEGWNFNSGNYLFTTDTK